MIDPMRRYCIFGMLLCLPLAVAPACGADLFNFQATPLKGLTALLIPHSCSSRKTSHPQSPRIQHCLSEATT